MLQGGAERDVENKSSEETLTAEYYVKDLDPRGALINPTTILGRQVKELRDVIKQRYLGKKE